MEGRRRSAGWWQPDIIARFVLCWRLFLAVMSLPSTALEAAAKLDAPTMRMLLREGLRRTRGGHVRRWARYSGARSSSGGDDTPASDDAAVSDDAQCSGVASDAGAASETGATIGPPPVLDSEARREGGVLAVDIGGTRTKFLLVEGGTCTRLPPATTARIWQNPELEGPDRFEPSSAPQRVRAYLEECGVAMERVGRLAFSVPGTGARARLLDPCRSPVSLVCCARARACALPPGHLDCAPPARPQHTHKRARALTPYTHTAAHHNANHLCLTHPGQAATAHNAPPRCVAPSPSPPSSAPQWTSTGATGGRRAR